MVDVNINSEMKVVGASITPALVREEREKPQVAPVQENSDSARAALGDKELHRRSEQAKESRKREAEQNFEEMRQLGEEIQERLDQMGTSLGFSLHKDEATEIVVARISNMESGELIRQIPSEEILQIRERLDELAGLIFDEEV